MAHLDAGLGISTLGQENAAASISNAELAAADEYEVADVKRVSVRLASGTEAFVYVSALS